MRVTPYLPQLSVLEDVCCVDQRWGNGLVQLYAQAQLDPVSENDGGLEL